MTPDLEEDTNQLALVRNYAEESIRLRFYLTAFIEISRAEQVSNKLLQAKIYAEALSFTMRIHLVITSPAKTKLCARLFID